MIPKALWPEPIVIRFVRRFFAKPGRVLDIGSGSGNHASFFELEGWDVVTVDRFHRWKPRGLLRSIWYYLGRLFGRHWHWRADIRKCHFGSGDFDLILDHNTLCHVEDPPYQKIHDWLTPGGRFLCVHPMYGTWEGVAEGKRYTLFASHTDMEGIINRFDDWHVKPMCYPDFKGNMIKSWVAWGRK